MFAAVSEEVERLLGADVANMIRFEDGHGTIVGGWSGGSSPDTDGLVERRGRCIDDGIAALAAAVRRHRESDVERLADAVLDELRADAAAPDDTALVIARSTG